MTWITILILFAQQLWAEPLPALLFPTNYQEGRQLWQETLGYLKNKGLHLQSGFLPVDTVHQPELAIDWAYVESKKVSHRLIVVNSGIHGVEAPTGMAIQNQWLRSSDFLKVLEHSSVLIIHGLNPHGFFYQRRVTANNVDLNRNFMLFEEDLTTINPAYSELKDFLNPQQSLQITLWQDVKLFLKTLWILWKQGRKALSQAVLEGQYRYPEGIYYGGKIPEPQSPMIMGLYQEMASSKKKILHIDLHTGYGARGKLHLLSSRELLEEPDFKVVFNDLSLDFGDDKNFYKTHGSFDSYIFTYWSKQNRTVVPITFEFGTMNSQTTLGGFWSLRNMIYENQAHHHATQDPQSKEQIYHDFTNMFAPQDSLWRKLVLDQGLQHLNLLSERFGTLE